MRTFLQKCLFLVLCITLVGTAHAQKQVVKGKVSDESGALVGVTVLVVGTTTGATTDAQGEYSITVDATQTLSFSYLGYKKQEIVVGPKTVIDVVLVSDAQSLDDVVVIGYGVQRKSDVIGSVASVKADELMSTPSGNIGDMLRGRATGVQVTTSSGRPGSEPTIMIRGNRSLSSNNSPLYIIDGTPASSTEFAAISSSDVESVEILKDAASQAIYGARAANGVILVTTKRGSADKIKVTFDSYVSFNSLWQNFDLYSPTEFYDVRALAQANDLGVDVSTLTPEMVFTDQMMLDSYNAGETLDWIDLMMRDVAITQKYDVGVSGGTEKLKVAASAGYYNQQGITKYDSGFKRFNLRANMDYKINNYVKIGLNSSFSKSDQLREDGNLSMYITRQPYGKIYDENGNLTPEMTSAGDVNPLFASENFERQIIRDQYRLNPFIEIKPFKSLTYKFNASYYSDFEEDGSYKSSLYPGGGASGSLLNDKQQNYLIENIVNFTAPINNKDHSLVVTAVQSYDYDVFKRMDVSANQVPVDMEQGWNMLGDGVITEFNRSNNETLLLSFMGRVQYGYKGKYLVSAAWRRDGSSKFGANNKWGDFPSVSAGWRITEEPFMQNVETISNLKLRASWGQVGNQSGIGRYTTLGNTISYPMEFGDKYITGYLPGSELSNPNLKWETTTSTNVGIDFGLFNNRLSGSIEGYLTTTSDLLVNRSINASLGYTSMLSNLGETKTKGFELNLTGDIIRKRDLTWNASLNLSKYVNEIVKINGTTDPTTGKYLDDVANKWFIGSPINVYYDYIFDGIYQLSDFVEQDGVYYEKPTVDTDGDGVGDKVLHRSDNPQPGDIKVKDINGDGEITADDRTQINKDPDFILSLASSLNYKGFDLFMDWYFVHGGNLRNSYLHEYNDGGTIRGALNGVKRDYWTTTNPSNTAPSPRFTETPPYMTAQAYQEKTYVRLRTLSLGYNFPQSWLSKANIGTLRLYVSATNLFTASDMLSYSPELSTGAYPETKQWVFGVNMSF